jgi:hypothetical protein
MPWTWSWFPWFSLMTVFNIVCFLFVAWLGFGVSMLLIRKVRKIDLRGMEGEVGAVIIMLIGLPFILISGSIWTAVAFALVAYLWASKDTALR